MFEAASITVKTWQRAARHFLEHAIPWHGLLSQLTEVLPRGLRWSWEGLHGYASISVPALQISSAIEP